MEETKHCPYCGEEILATAKKCRYCGEWLDEQHDEAMSQQQDIREDVVCPMCAEPIEKGTKVCPHCHTVLVEEEEQDMQLQPDQTEETSLENEPLQEPVEEELKEEEDGSTRSFFSYYFVDVFLKHYADFKGKICRKQFWMGYVCYVLLMLVSLSVDFLLESPLIVTSIVNLALLVPSLAFMVRRLHDTGKSGWWILISCVPLIGTVWLFVLLCQKGEGKPESVKQKPNDIKIWIGIVALIVLAILKMWKDFDEYTITIPAEEVAAANPGLFDNGSSDDYVMEESDAEDLDSIEIESDIPAGDALFEAMASGPFHGYIDNKYECSFNLSFEGPDVNNVQTVSGTYYYDEKGAENLISVRGNYNLNTGKLSLTEYAKDGTPNSTISAVNASQIFRGVFKTRAGKELEFFIYPES